jgi:hypothetical protein
VVDEEGRNVWASTPEGATDEDTGTYLLGPILGFVLRLRGVVCLHASAVEGREGALAFVGPAGAGKSSIAAAFSQRGHRVLTDDVGALRRIAGKVHVLPAYPRIRLWPDAAKGLFGSSEALPRITPTWDKRYLDLAESDRRFVAQPLPLAGIYLIEEDPAASRVRVAALEPRRALMGLVAQMYSTRLLDRTMRAHEFEFLSGLVQQVPVSRLTRPASYGCMQELCDGTLREAGTARAA